MSNESNQPVFKRSSKVQTIIDMLEDEILLGKDSHEIDKLIDEFNLDISEKGEIVKSTQAFDVKCKELQLSQSSNITAMIIGSSSMIMGLLITFFTMIEGGIIFYFSLAMMLGGGYYFYIHLKHYSKNEVTTRKSQIRKTRQY